MSELLILNLIGKESELFVQDVNFYNHELQKCSVIASASYSRSAMATLELL